MALIKPAATVRPAVKSDLPGILRLYAQPQADDGNVMDLREAEVLFDHMQRYPDYRLYVAELDGCVVGSFALLVMENLAHLGAPSGIVEDVVVAPEHHRRGIGRLMMAFAMDHCRERGCYKLALSANRIRKHAHAFYKSIGFKIHGYSFLVEFDRK